MAPDTSLGILELSDRGAGFVRRRQYSYLAEDGDLYVAPRLISQFGLRSGDELWGEVGRPQGRGKSAPLEKVTLVNGRPPDEARRRPNFASLGAIHPDAPLLLDCGLRRFGQPDFTNRVIDLLCPFGKGQRALIVAPAKAGKTMVLQSVAEGVAKNYPDSLLLILLVDERPEEVTEMEMIGYGEVISSSFDFPAERHVAVAELTLERARRRVEQGEDVILILDSITRLARAYNTVERGTGRTMTGGLDSSALEKPKKFLGSARRIDEAKGGGSLTIIGTALIDTGSKMDQVIYEEFKGTGNSELTLSRELAERRIFPAIDLKASGTRREELLLPPALLAVTQALRARLAPVTAVDAMQQVLQLMKRYPSNAELGGAV
ncbi:MAG: transcription termination factor Rho [Gemmatimonadota bacterium]